MRKRWVFITSICAGLVLVATLLCVVIFQLRHKHVLGDAKVYHIYNDRITYTRKCVKDSRTQKFDTEATFAEVVANLGRDDRIVVEENITASQIFKINSGSPQSVGAKKDVVVNIDLNNKSICSMFELNASYANIKFNISNGTIYSNYTNAIKVGGLYGEVELNIINVDCISAGAKNASLYIENAYNAIVNARDSKFISQNESLIDSDYGVGVFINNKGDFKFENCLLEGGDGLHVREGKIMLTGCDLVNTGLLNQSYQSVVSGFCAVGASLTAHCYTSGAGTTNFEITVENCVMTTNNSNRVINVYSVAKTGYEPRLNSDSFIKIKSCKFNQNPEEYNNFDKVIYESGSTMTIDGQGCWVYGDVNR